MNFFTLSQKIGFSQLWIAIICFSGLFVACQSDENTSQTAKKSTKNLPKLELLSPEATGIDFANVLRDNPETKENILSSPTYFHGAGVGMGDFDNDGMVDVFLAGNEVPHRIYKNLGDLKFEDKTAGSGINENKNWGSGVSVIDINNDGLLDVYVGEASFSLLSSERQNTFYINKGNFQFEEKSRKMGLNDGNRTTQAAFLDYDKDGDLDVYVLNYSKYLFVLMSTYRKALQNPDTLRANSGRLYRNDGNLKFTDVTKEAGVLEHSFGLGVVVSDFNNDNYPDLYVANDFSVPDRLYINQKDGTFKDEIKTVTNSISFYSMGCDAADINNDGFIDLGVVDMATPDHFRGKTLMASMDSEAFNYYTKNLGYQYQYMFNALQLNNGNGTFSNIAGLTGLQKTDWSWAAIFADMNLDGFKDYFVSNGYKRYARDNDFRIKMSKIRAAHNDNVPNELRRQLYEEMPIMRLQNLLYINRGDLQFDENPEDFPFVDEAGFSYGAAYGDLDNDGDLDLIVNNIDDPAYVIKNNSREADLGNYLTVALKHPDNTAMVYNSKVTIFYDDQVQTAEYAFTRGYCSSMDQRVFFGLGKNQKVDRIEVLWPDGNVQIIQDPSINEQHTIAYAKQANAQLTSLTKSDLLFEEVDPASIGLDFVHQENDFEDFAKEVLLPQRQSTMGPALASGDINGDGLMDLFCGGAMNQAGAIYLQQSNGGFTKASNEFLDFDRNTEDVDALFVDPNKDGKKDLIIASGGGGEMAGEQELLMDRFYANTGKKIGKTKAVLPPNVSASYRIVAGDYNHDDKEDLVICGAAKPGLYPQSESTRLYTFEGTYKDVTDERIPELAKIPLVRDVAFADVNQDNLDDLLVVSEWGKPRLFIAQQDGTFTEETDQYFNEEHYGWWASITAADLDNDGDVDFILGNVGENLKHSVSKKKPLLLYANDFDKNGSLDVVLAKDYKGKIVPARGRECSSQQMPFIEQKFESYTAFANADLEEILGEKSVDEAQKFKANTFASYILRNDGQKLSYEKLPALAQVAPIHSVLVKDLDQDQYPDIIIAGNNYDTEYETPRLDAGRGLVLMNKAGKTFQELAPFESGLNLNGNLRKICWVDQGNRKLLVGAQSNGPLKVFALKE